MRRDKIDLNLAKLTEEIETLRQQLVQMYLEGISMNSDVIVCKSQELDILLNEFHSSLNKHIS
ncbi:Spo0E family sporulation regulatory protein-aspartic acid phosphatase [Bacillus sp. 3255]|uniref:Spo0E family sporulation regulatory protein-aspartic acid phosphatase n=1 Tax=Bacillus sp. 3255 TaxID=2817904 RepID=UPI0037C1254A